MSEQFTPGPWSVESPMGDGADDSLWIVEANKPTYEWRCLAMVSADTDEPRIPVTERDANARLIAAAPELYEACEGVLARFESGENLSRLEADWLRAALRKARGENTPGSEGMK